MTNKKYSVVKQFGTDKDYYTIFSSDGEQECYDDGDPIRYDEYEDAKEHCDELNYSDTQWERYLKYLMMWTLDHQNEYYEGMSPACYDEFCDNDDEPEYYEEQLDYTKIERDCKETIKHWKGE
jgi:hypothetical protein